jgi:hypothetical protein
VAIYTGDVISSIDEVVSPSILTLTPYPNPAENSLQLNGWNRETQFPVVVSVYNASGALVDEQMLLNKESSLNTSWYDSGFYFGSVKDENAQQATFRFVIAENDER